MTDDGKPRRPQNLFEFIVAVIFFGLPAFIGTAACMIANIILFPVIWLVEGFRGKVPPEVAPPRAMETLPTPASEADARSLEIQDRIEAESRRIAWEQIRAANTKREASSRKRG
jgi:hypothetical protein